MVKRIYITTISLVIMIPLAVHSQGMVDRLKQKEKKRVEGQYKSDIERKEAILRKMRAFISEINGQLALSSKTRISAPIDINKATDITTTDHFHTPKKVMPPVYAYADDRIRTKTSRSIRSSNVGKLNFGEKVEVIVQTKEKETVNGKEAPWVLVRKASGEEGWVHGSALIKEEKAPNKKVKIPDEVKTAKKKSKFYAYVMDDSVNMRSAGTTRSSILGKYEYGEKVEVLVQSKNMDTINGKRRPWFLVKRANGLEGWIFGGFLQTKKPAPRRVVSSAPGTDLSKDFVVPTVGRRSSNFGYRVHPVTKKKGSFHKGIDIAAPKGTPVKATADGVVKRSEYNRNGYGNLIVLQHEKDVSSYYGHLEKRNVKSGQRVKKGEIIGTIDSTGLSTGHHLHFEVRKGRTAMNPDNYLR